MSLSQLTKQRTHFLVRYECDNRIQVRTRGFFRTDEEILIDGSYVVQWGRKNDVDTATVVSAGTGPEMKVACTRLKTATMATAKPKAGNLTNRKDSRTRSGKPPATVAKAASPAGYYPDSTAVYGDTSLPVTTPTSSGVTDFLASSASTTQTSVGEPEVLHVRDTLTSVVDSVDEVVTDGNSGLEPLQSRLARLAALSRSNAAESFSILQEFEAVTIKLEKFDRKIDVLLSLVERLLELKN